MQYAESHPREKYLWFQTCELIELQIYNNQQLSVLN